MGRGHDLGIPAEQVAAAEAVIEALKRVPGAAPVASSSREASPQQAPAPAESPSEGHSATEEVWAMTDVRAPLLWPFSASDHQCCSSVAVMRIEGRPSHASAYEVQPGMGK